MIITIMQIPKSRVKIGIYDLYYETFHQLCSVESMKRCELGVKIKINKCSPTSLSIYYNNNIGSHTEAPETPGWYRLCHRKMLLGKQPSLVSNCSKKESLKDDADGYDRDDSVQGRGCTAKCWRCSIDVAECGEGGEVRDEGHETERKKEKKEGKGAKKDPKF